MEPLIALTVVTLGVRAAGALGARRLASWPVALRGGLAAMFLLTAGAHFIGLRDELVAMVPPALPAPELLVTVTGLLEAAGALGLLYRPTAPWAAAGLTAMLLGMFPANVYKAAEGLSTDFTDQLVPRTVMQLIFLAATATVTVHYMRARRGDPEPYRPEPVDKSA